MSEGNFLEELMKERRALSVSDLTSRIKSLIEGRFTDVWVEGEISNFRRHSSGHWYFTLKDEIAALRCASFRMQNRLMRFSPEDGMTVRARGRLSIYEARGEYQLLVEYIEPVGAGALQLALEQLRRRLAAEGLFDAGRKRSLPLLPRRIGVVTSPTGAAIRDILRVLRRRNEGVGVLIAPARVQGDGAPRDIAEAIAALNTREEVDVIIVGRGGGSIEDLATFNEERVARAIFASRAPVISAVGHEADVTIADLVADLRASTPSAAAEMVVMARDHIGELLTGLNGELATCLHYKLLELRRRVSSLHLSRKFDEIPFRVRVLARRVDSAVYAMDAAIKGSLRSSHADFSPLAARLRESEVRHLINEHRSKVASLGASLQTSERAILERSGEKLGMATGKLDALSPLGVLGRGYAIVFDRAGNVIRSPNAVKRGDRLRLRVAEGEMDCVRS